MMILVRYGEFKKGEEINVINRQKIPCRLVDWLVIL